MSFRAARPSVGPDRRAGTARARPIVTASNWGDRTPRGPQPNAQRSKDLEAPGSDERHLRGEGRAHADAHVVAVHVDGHGAGRAVALRVKGGDAGDRAADD